MPKIVRQPRGFLSKAEYYNHFVAGYATITLLLTCLLKKRAFKWAPEAQQAFDILNLALSTTLVLTLLDFSQPFIIKWMPLG